MSPCSYALEYLTGLVQNFSWHPWPWVTCILLCFLDALWSKKSCRTLLKTRSRLWKAAASHSPTSLQALIYFYSKDIFHDLTSNRTYRNANSCYLGNLSLVPEWKKGSPLAVASLMRPCMVGGWGCQRKRGGAGLVTLSPTAGCLVWYLRRYLKALELRGVSETPHQLSPRGPLCPLLLKASHPPFTAVCNSN